MKNYNKNKNRRGMSLAPVLVFSIGFTSVGIGVISLTSTYNRSAKKTTDKWQSTSLAESGAHVLYDQIRQQMLNDVTFPFNLNSTTVKVPLGGGNEETVGVYSARVIANREVQTDVEEGGNKYRKFTYYFTIEGRGKATGGVESVIRTSFKGEIYRHMVPRNNYGATPPPDTFNFPIGAIVSNENVQITTNNGLRTLSTDGENSAHVIANAGIRWDPASGSKNSQWNPNVIDIKGFYLVPDGGPFSSTVSAAGLGNPNGSKNYRSPAAPRQGDFPGAAANTVIKLASKVEFADEGTVNGWQNDWRSQASVPTGTSFSGNVSWSSLPPRPNDGKVGIQAPAIVNGDLNVENGRKIELWPASTDPKKNVVYVKGNVRNLGQIVNHGVTLVFEGGYSDDSDAEYKIEPDSQTFKTVELAVMRSALLSLKKSKDAFKFSTNSSARTGIIYALKGGIEVTGANAEFTGMLLAGGTSTNGGINIRPGGGASFVVKYDPYAATGGELALDSESIIDTEYVAGNVARGFQPTKLIDWIQTK